MNEVLELGFADGSNRYDGFDFSWWESSLRPDSRPVFPKLLILEVADNGCGIDGEILGRIFNPFGRNYSGDCPGGNPEIRNFNRRLK